MERESGCLAEVKSISCLGLPSIPQLSALSRAPDALKVSTMLLCKGTCLKFAFSVLFCKA
jgi:hypothetical protein